MKSQVKTEMLEMEDPTFETGVIKTARARMTNPTVEAFTYTVELYLGIAKAATSGVQQVIIPAGQYADVTFTIAMPAVAGDYPVFLDVWQDTTLLKHYQATENVVIEVTPAIDVGPITWV